MRDEFSINRPWTAEDVFRLALCGVKAYDEQRQLLSCTDALHADAHEWVACVESLGRQAAAHSAKLASARGDMTLLNKSAEAA